jgi:hypothetical protein
MLVRVILLATCAVCLACSGSGPAAVVIPLTRDDPGPGRDDPGIARDNPGAGRDVPPGAAGGTNCLSCGGRFLCSLPGVQTPGPGVQTPGLNVPTPSMEVLTAPLAGGECHVISAANPQLQGFNVTCDGRVISAGLQVATWQSDGHGGFAIDVPVDGGDLTLDCTPAGP